MRVGIIEIMLHQFILHLQCCLEVLSNQYDVLFWRFGKSWKEKKECSTDEEERLAHLSRRCPTEAMHD